MFQIFFTFTKICIDDSKEKILIAGKIQPPYFPENDKSRYFKWCTKKEALRAHYVFHTIQMFREIKLHP